MAQAGVLYVVMGSRQPAQLLATYQTEPSILRLALSPCVGNDQHFNRWHCRLVWEMISTSTPIYFSPPIRIPILLQ